MKESEKITPSRKLFIMGITIILLVLIMSTFFGKKGLIEIRQARRHQAELLAKIVYLEKVKAKLEKEIEELRKTPQMIEEEARKKLWLMKPEEKVLILHKNKESKKD